MRIHAIQTGTVAIKTRQLSGRGRGTLRPIITLLDTTWTEPVPIYAWVIEHPEGLIVVDTGETARVAEPGYFPWWQPYFKLGVREWVRPEEEIGPQLRALGFAPADVRWVLLTHFHTDHAGGLPHFPTSEILVSRTEYQAACATRSRSQ
jgi:N-acyl homoserine lactone hydrolase